MSRAAIVAALLALAACLGACDDARPPVLPDAGCREEGTAPDQPALSCPAEVDLGCIPASGAPITITATASACDGSTPTITCTPASGAIVTPGTTSGRCVATAASGATAECSFAIRSRVEGAPSLACEAAITAECTGARTTISLAPATAVASCGGGSAGTPASDAPADGFPLGSTTVTWTAPVEGGAPISCTTPVTITDTTAPVIDCAGAPTRIVRRAPGASLDLAVLEVRDACDDALEITLDPMPTTRGTYAIEARATDDAGRTGTCTWNVEIVDAFAPTGLRVLSAELAGDGSTDVTLGWDPTSGDVTAVRLERAESEAGPFTAIATLPEGTITYTDASMPGPRAFYRVVALVDALEGGASAVVRALSLAPGTEYNLRNQMVPTLSFRTSLYGVVRHPADLAGGPYPLVVFLHGNHGNCRPPSGDDECATLTTHECPEAGFTTTPNAEGYLYLQETLAAQGFVTVSLSANALNCRDEFIAERVQLLLEHLRRWAGWAGAGGAPFGTTFAGRVDLTRVSLVGHSRGGEAVAGAPAALRATPIAGVSLASVFAIGPTDFGNQRPSGVPFAVLLPGCDADVSTLEGLQQYDRGLDPGDANARAQVLYVGANHNFFNTEWRFDDNDGPGRVCTEGNLVGGPAQRGMLEVVLSDWIGAASAEARFASYLRAESSTPAVLDAWAGRALDLRWSYAAAMRRVIDDFLGGAANDLGGMDTFTGYTADVTCTGTCARNWSHLTGGIRLAWQDAAATAVFPTGTLDASAYDVVSIRFASRIATLNDGLTGHDLGIRVRDAAGTSAEVALSSVGRLPHRFTSGAEQEILNTVRVPTARLTEVAPTLDLSRVTSVELSMPIAGGNAQGSIWVADVEVAGD